MTVNWLDGADEVSGRRKEKEALTLLTAAGQHSHAQSSALTALANVGDVWCSIAALVLPPRPELSFCLSIPVDLAGTELPLAFAAVMKWASCVNEKVHEMEEDSLRHPALETPNVGHIEALRRQASQARFLLDQIQLPDSLHSMAWVEKQKEIAPAEIAPAEQMLKDSVSRLESLYHSALEHAKYISLVMAG
mmetsp:Transcript_37802/g.66618  ORF Transcript_37802/g.66618 Transcript_37802/m.66618 type:complete len:192 (-) Transcript_37802:64-639(-)